MFPFFRRLGEQEQGDGALGTLSGVPPAIPNYASGRPRGVPRRGAAVGGGGGLGEEGGAVGAPSQRSGARGEAATRWKSGSGKRSSLAAEPGVGWQAPECSARRLLAV